MPLLLLFVNWYEPLSGESQHVTSSSRSSFCYVHFLQLKMELFQRAPKACCISIPASWEVKGGEMYLVSSGLESARNSASASPVRMFF